VMFSWFLSGIVWRNWFCCYCLLGKKCEVVLLPSVISKQPRWMLAEISTRQTAGFHDKPAKDASHGEEMNNNLHGSALKTITTKEDEKTYNKTNK
jgi:hypothetical protein